MRASVQNAPVLCVSFYLRLLSAGFGFPCKLFRPVLRTTSPSLRFALIRDVLIRALLEVPSYFVCALPSIRPIVSSSLNCLPIQFRTPFSNINKPTTAQNHGHHHQDTKNAPPTSQPPCRPPPCDFQFAGTPLLAAVWRRHVPYVLVLFIPSSPSYPHLSIRDPLSQSAFAGESSLQIKPGIQSNQILDGPAITEYSCSGSPLIPSAVISSLLACSWRAILAFIFDDMRFCCCIACRRHCSCC